jgi:hypothetical protein
MTFKAQPNSRKAMHFKVRAFLILFIPFNPVIMSRILIEYAPKTCVCALLAER